MIAAGGVRLAAAGRRGQALVELALVVPVFLLIVFGVIDGGRLVYMNDTLSQVAREAARVGAVEAPVIGASPCTAPRCPANTTALRADMLAGANRMAVGVGPLADAAMYVDCTASGSPRSGAWTGGNSCSTNNVAGKSNVVNVRVVAAFKPLTPIVGQIIDALYPSAESLWADSSMVIP